MSYSVDPPHLIGLADRMRCALDEVHEVATALQRSVDAAARALTRALPAHTAIVELATGRLHVAVGFLARGRTSLAALQTVLLAYVTADEEMSDRTDAAALGAESSNPFDPIAFGRRRI